ncbi:transposase [Escherichia coli]|nr:transposase [Escherichia coli]NKA24337.1 hypothetical protein [Escherichia coli]
MKMAVQGFQGPLNEAALAGRHLSGQKGKLLHCASLHSVDDAHNGAAFRMLQGVIPQPVIMDRHGIILHTTGMMTVRHQTGGNNWPNLATFFAYPTDIRKVIYTTNAIESLNSVIRHAIKKRKVFPTDDSVKKVVWLAIQSASQKWTIPLKDWRMATSRLEL